ncbi:ferritin-like domain-containing protein [Deinococcus oregonensis]|uniref:Ferritin-like domain-containing protein n=1 Tax=Deinococcus oregonensis TaxID=1805970 RepID=A0ABV6B1S6_9DEIO
MSNDTTKPANSRRQFLGAAGLMGAGALIAGCAPVIATTPAKPNLDATIFNFALNLEYLEAAFYLAAVGRLGELTTVGGDSTKVTLPDSFKAAAFNGVGIPTLSPEVRAYATETANDEKAHVAVIRRVLGAAAVNQPQIDLAKAFLDAGNLASGGKITGFDPFANELFFLHGAFIFEDVGVSAYKGAARLLVDDKAGGNLENAAGILAVEAYHAGSIRTQLYARRNDPAAAGLNVGQVVKAISDLRDKVDGSDDRDQGILTDGIPSTSANIVLADADSIAFSRTPRQVANIVLLDTTGAAATGGFFPAGLTGDFSTILAL